MSVIMIARIVCDECGREDDYDGVGNDVRPLRSSGRCERSYETHENRWSVSTAKREGGQRGR